MAAWRMAKSLEVLRESLNEAFPRRSKASDGGIGDARHQASSSSDHNPHVKLDGKGVVTARDFTHDPKTGIDCNWLADTLVKNRDPRIKYIIWDRRILSSKTAPWKWRPYNGANAHTKHLHISVMADPKLFDSEKPWDLDFPDDESTDIATVEPRAEATVADPTPSSEVEKSATAPAEQQQQPASSQVADQIINTAPTPEPVIAAAASSPAVETEERKPTGIIGKVIAFIGLVFTGQATLPSFVTEADSGFWGVLAKIFLGLWEFKVYILGALFLWFVIVKGESVIMRLAAMRYNTDPTKGNVILTEQPRKSWADTLKFWK